MFDSLFHPGAFVYQQVLLVIASSLTGGLLLATLYKIHNATQGKYPIILAIIPVVSAMIIMLINGNIGASIAIAASFGIIRFRSAAGTAAEIGYLFVALMLGLMNGMGYVVLSIVSLIIVAVFIFILETIGFSSPTIKDKRLRITIPENCNYANLFNDVFEKYTKSTDLVRVRTTNMGTLYELTYVLKLKDYNVEKDFIDELRCRNGNLDIILGVLDREKNEM